jgi:orotate phosphoribosyltransferase
MTISTPIQDFSLEQLQDLLLSLLCERAYKEGEFTLSSGQASSYYINCKVVTLDAVGAFAMGRLLYSRLPSTTQAIAGLTLGADPMVSAVSLVSALDGHPISGLIVRKQSKGHGTQAYIEGPRLEPGSEVVVLEDVVTTGQSALQAVQRLKEAGYRVSRILALVDRQQGGAQTYRELGLEFETLFTIEDIQRYSAEVSSHA